MGVIKKLGEGPGTADKKEKVKRITNSQKRKIVALEKAKSKQLKQELQDWFLWNGTKFFKPKYGLKVVDQKYNLIADVRAEQFSLDESILEAIKTENNYLLVLLNYEESEFKYTALTVRFEDILKAREQRFHLAFTAGLETVASLIARDLEDAVDPLITDPKEVIDKYKEEYLSTANYCAIFKDIERIIKSICELN